MRVAVLGLRHLGQVAAACLAEKGIEVVAWDPNTVDIVDEPDMPESDYESVLESKDAVTNADVLWLTFDTPIGGDKPDVDKVFQWAGNALKWASAGQRVIVSSQLPIGSVGKMADKYPHLKFFCSPENLRRGQAVKCFKNQQRVIIGTPDYPDEKVMAVFKPFCDNLFWCSVESAEFVKHALNSWLAMNIAWANEIGNIAIKHGANPTAIEWALRNEGRIGDKAPIGYNKGGIGPHLSRDITYLREMAPEAHLIRGIERSSDDWEVGNGN